MEAFFWGLRTRDSFTFTWPIALTLAICLAFTQTDFLLLMLAFAYRRTRSWHDTFQNAAPGVRPTGMVIIPSLLRNDEDLNAITTTVESCATNGYPSDLLIIASVDGRTEKPALYARLAGWIAKQKYPAHVRVCVAGTETRLGKMMAVEAGVTFAKGLVERGEIPKLPDIYFSIDGDGTLGPDALERLAARITTPHPITGNPRRIVSGKICIRPDLFWRGWGEFFTSKGFLVINVAREFVVSNVARHNWKLTPKIGVPGALYCCWTDMLVQAPHYMGFMKTIRGVDWVKWWFGAEPPKFSESNAPACPEALTGASDDTCMAFLASISQWKDGKLCLDAPRTPLHAFVGILKGFFLERSHDYEPEARVYTFTPSTWKGLWTQRVRWNASRFECAGRFWRSFWFHWEIGLPVGAHLSTVLHTVLEVAVYYLLLPYVFLGNNSALLGYFMGYCAQTVSHTLYTTMALLIETERKQFWRVVACLPTASLYLVAINFFGCVYGVSRDLLFFGNKTNFAPEWTMKKGGCQRVALTFRARRFLSLCVRAAVRGDVPLGWFWLGWTETPWTPSGFDGWTTGKKSPSIWSFGIPEAAPSVPAPMPSLPALAASVVAEPTMSEAPMSADALRASLRKIEIRPSAGQKAAVPANDEATANRPKVA